MREIEGNRLIVETDLGQVMTISVDGDVRVDYIFRDDNGDKQTSRYYIKETKQKKLVMNK